MASGGYKPELVEKPSSDLKCLICLRVARDPPVKGENDESSCERMGELCSLEGSY